MSRLDETACGVADRAAHPAIETVVTGKTRDIGGFEVRRVLPSTRRRMVGPFVFFDQMGPADFPAGRGIDVRPHPHIGLATVTYLFAGEIVHRDSLGTLLAIRPGDVNWMTAGRGIAHSERTGDAVRAAGGTLAGIQAWVALPREAEEQAPAFAHHPASELPVAELDGCSVRLIAGSLFGVQSPVATAWETIYADARMQPGARLAFPAGHEERAVYPVEGAIELDGRPLVPGEMLVLRPGAEVVLEAQSSARMMLLGGAAMDGPRHIWWNFVSSSLDRIEQAKHDWQASRFDAVPGESEFIPLPAD